MQKNEPEQTTTEMRLTIASLARDIAFQARLGGTHEGTIRRYAAAYKAGSDLPPVEVARVGDVFVLVDGWHRVEALETLGHAEVPARVTLATNEEALGMAALANLAHGRPLKAKERRRAFGMYVKGGRHRGSRPNTFKPYSTIAAELGYPVGTVHKWMRDDFPKVAAKMSYAGRREGFQGRGGLPDGGGQGPAVQRALAALVDIKSAFSSTSDAEMRAAIIGMLETALSEMGSTGRTAERDDF